VARLISSRIRSSGLLGPNATPSTPPGIEHLLDRAFRKLGGFGQAYDDSMNYSSPQVVVVREPAPRPPWQHSEQTVTVPSENGGTSQVSILRC
jgi:hypothetical protein